MGKIFKLLLLLGAISLGWWIWTILFPKPEQVIRNRLNKLAHLASFSSGQGNIVRVANVQKMGRLFDENIQIAINAPGTEEPSLQFTHREELMQAALAASRFANGLKVEFVDMSIKVEPDLQSGTADLMLQAKAGGENEPIIQELKFTFKNADGDWLITRVETVKPIKP